MAKISISFKIKQVNLFASETWVGGGQGPASTRYPILFSSISLDTRLVSISSTYIRISSS